MYLYVHIVNESSSDERQKQPLTSMSGLYYKYILYN